MALRHNWPFSGLWAASGMIWAMVDQGVIMSSRARETYASLVQLVAQTIFERGSGKGSLNSEGRFPVGGGLARTSLDHEGV
jgi:hypothetical protein